MNPHSNFTLAFRVYATLLALVMGITTYVVLSMNLKINFLVLLWCLAFPATPLLILLNIFFSIFITGFFGIPLAQIIVAILSSALCWVGVWLQFRAIEAIVNSIKRRNSRKYDVGD